MNYRMSKLSRRKAFQLVAGAGAASVATSAGFRGVTAQSGTPAPITIPDTAATLPTEDVTFRWIDSGDLKSYFYRPFFEAYHEAHPNITIQYDALPWSEINRVVPLGIQNEEAHDVFAMPPDVPAAQAVQEGWVAPLDEVIPNFEEWKSRFPFGSFIEGVHDFNGRTYTWPVTSDKRYGTLLFFNPGYLEPAGYDFSAEPPTWDEFRAAARKVTEQGAGEYYGFIIAGQQTGQGGPLAGFVGNLARMAGASASGGAGMNGNIDWRTGEYAFTSDEYLAALDLLLALQSDGSIFPGALSLGGADARSRFPQGVAGMILTGPWDIANYQANHPDFQFGLSSQPIPTSGNPVPLTYEETGANQMWVYSGSPYKSIAGDMFTYTASIEGQVAIMVYSGGNLRSFFPEAVERAQATQQLDPMATKALDLFEQQVRMGPQVTIRNPEGAVAVAFEHQAITPDYGDVVQGIFAGQLSDPKAAMQDLKDRADAELDRAIGAAQDKGAQVSRDDWVFPNWDPTRDYTEEMYQEL